MLVERCQIEIMTGAYYEPILVSLLDEDRVSQIQKQTQAVREDFRRAISLTSRTGIRLIKMVRM